LDTVSAYSAQIGTKQNIDCIPSVVVRDSHLLERPYADLPKIFT